MSVIDALKPTRYPTMKTWAVVLLWTCQLGSLTMAIAVGYGAAPMLWIFIAIMLFILVLIVNRTGWFCA